MEEEFDFSDILDNLDFITPYVDRLDPSVPNPRKRSTNKPPDYLKSKKELEFKNSQYSNKLFKSRSERSKNINQVMTGGKDMFDFSDIIDQQLNSRGLQGPYRGPE